jgi:hypothetical protein
MMDLEEFSLEPVVEELMPFMLNEDVINNNKIRLECAWWWWWYPISSTARKLSLAIVVVSP